VTADKEGIMSNEPTPAQKIIGDFAPKLVSLTDDVLFGDVWARTEFYGYGSSEEIVGRAIANYSRRDSRSSSSRLITVGENFRQMS
jgi:4-carboxymuconolactone decarboxylase